MTAAVRIAVVVLLVALLAPALAAACPLCKEAEADTPGGSASLGRGFYYSILLMIAVPWTAVGTVAFLIFRKRRRDRSSAPATGSAGLVNSEAGARPQDLSPRHSQMGAGPQDLSPRHSPVGARP